MPDYEKYYPAGLEDEPSEATPTHAEYHDHLQDGLANLQQQINDLQLGAQIASTVGALDPYPGAQAQLRLGGSPYEFVPLIYDDTYGKWVTAEEHIELGKLPFSTASASYVDATQALAIPGFLLRYDAGLRPQFRLSIRANAGHANSAAALVLWQVSNGSGTQDFVAGPFAEVATGGTVRPTSDWVEPSITPTSRDHGQIGLRAKSGTGTFTVDHAHVTWRWVGTPS